MGPLWVSYEVRKSWRLLQNYKSNERDKSTFAAISSLFDSR